MDRHPAVDPDEMFANFTASNNQRQRSFGQQHPFERAHGGLEEMHWCHTQKRTHDNDSPSGRTPINEEEHYHQQAEKCSSNNCSHVPERIVLVSCSLEELYNGCTRSMKVQRKRIVNNMVK